jgi:hypothetical protein
MRQTLSLELLCCRHESRRILRSLLLAILLLVGLSLIDAPASRAFRSSLIGSKTAYHTHHTGEPTRHSVAFARSGKRKLLLASWRNFSARLFPPSPQRSKRSVTGPASFVALCGQRPILVCDTLSTNSSRTVGCSKTWPIRCPSGSPHKRSASTQAVWKHTPAPLLIFPRSFPRRDHS